MSASQIMQYVSYAAILANVAFASFVSAAPADHPLLWWVVPAVATLNAIVHALPSTGLPVPVAPVVAAPVEAVKP